MRRKLDDLRVSWLYFRQLGVDYVVLRWRYLKKRISTSAFAHRLRNSFLWILGIGIIAYLIMDPGYRTEWTGFSEFIDSQDIIHRGKTLWDWMELLIVPVAIAIGAYYFTRNERKSERESARDHQREIALQTYFDRLSALLLDAGLIQSTKGSPVRTVARSRTLALLRELDGFRKGVLVRFLFESGLIDRPSPVVSLRGADLSGADLSAMNLDKAYLHGVDLDGADLSYSSCYSSDFGGCTIVGANLTSVKLTSAQLEYTRFDKSDLYGSDLSNSKLGISTFVDSDLERANLIDANIFRADMTGAKLRKSRLDNADLHRTKLVDADLSYAILSGANLTESNLKRANLKGADFSRADLTGASVNWKQIRQAKSLKGTKVKGIWDP